MAQAPRDGVFVGAYLPIGVCGSAECANIALIYSPLAADRRIIQDRISGRGGAIFRANTCGMPRGI
jgi:hypothetical protein